MADGWSRNSVQEVELPVVVKEWLKSEPFRAFRVFTFRLSSSLWFKSCRTELGSWAQLSIINAQDHQRPALKFSKALNYSAQFEVNAFGIHFYSFPKVFGPFCILSTIGSLDSMTHTHTHAHTLHSTYAHKQNQRSHIYTNGPQLSTQTDNCIYLHTHTFSHILTHSHTFSHTHSHTFSHTHTHIFHYFYSCIGALCSFHADRVRQSCRCLSNQLQS